MNWTLVIACILVMAFGTYVFVLSRIAFGKMRTSTPVEKTDSGFELESLLASTNLDCELALLWQTESPALEKLKQSGANGLSEDSLHDYYSQIAERYPELCEGSDFDKWVDTLERLEVIVREGDSFKITEKGLFILDFVSQQTKCPCEDVALLQNR